ncbi:MAG: excinuclease ABC subunit UvrC, partial [Balneolaceae bacterium]
MSQNSLQDKVDHLPQAPGVYLYRDSEGQLLYVGKAKRLRTRVKSYFRESGTQEGRIRLMISKIADLEVIVTDSEAEALILENNLIKQHHPRYNIMYRDDKSYPYICMTKGERPQVFPTRMVLRDGSKYFGPYDHVGLMRRMLETIRHTFQLCTCAVSPKTVDPTRGTPRWGSCFDDYLGSCSGDLDPELYKETMSQVERMLGGKTEELIRELKEEMRIAADALEYESAARIRDSVEALEKYNSKMKMVAEKQVNRDLFALSVDEEMGEACGVLFKIREGKLIGKFHRFLKNISGRERGEMLQSFIEDYYTGYRLSGAGAIPDEVYVSDDLPEPDALLEYLWQEHGSRVPVHEPKIGEKRQLIRMAQSNATLILGERQREKMKAEKDRIPQSVQDLKRFLKLERLPRRIECFDISNMQGTDTVASMVTFVDAQPRKSEYKKFHIRSVEGADDFASMKEVVGRRYKRVKQEKQQIPDLILIDGGKGQLSAAVEALRSIGFEGECEIAGLAKRLEEVFLPSRMDAVMIPKTSPALKLLQRARDEAHRFAVTFHKKKRANRTLKTELTSIPGVGTKRAEELLRRFGSVNRVKSASRDELSDTVGKRTGNSVFDHYH